MADYQDSKTLVLQFYEELEAASVDDVAKVMNRYMSSDYQFRGVHPFFESSCLRVINSAKSTRNFGHTL